MKNRSQYKLIIVCILHILCLTPSSSFSQPEFDFRNPILLSGTLNQPGARYRFSNVRTGTDAIVTHVSNTGGMTLSQLDGASGYVEAFQPVVRAPAGAYGYIEFLIQFVNTGTLVPRVMTEVPVTAIDVDGRVLDGGDINKLYEYVTVSLNPSGNYFDYDKILGELNVTQTDNYVTGKNVPGVSYVNVDTSAKNVMFTTVNANISSMTIRCGVENNRLGIETRLNSIYFKKFEYPNSFLAVSSLKVFEGFVAKNRVHLKWQIHSSSFTEMIVERAVKGKNFQPVHRTLARAGTSSFEFIDSPPEGEHYFRLKITHQNGIEYSRILHFDVASDKTYRIYPSFFNKQGTLEFESGISGMAQLRLIDMSGAVVHSQQLLLMKGKNLNTITFGDIQPGKYAAVLIADHKQYVTSIIKR